MALVAEPVLYSRGRPVGVRMTLISEATASSRGDPVVLTSEDWTGDSGGGGGGGGGDLKRLRLALCSVDASSDREDLEGACSPCAPASVSSVLCTGSVAGIVTEREGDLSSDERIPEAVIERPRGLAPSPDGGPTLRDGSVSPSEREIGSALEPPPLIAL